MQSWKLDDILVPCPGLQWVQLADGRLLARHHQGTTIRPALPLEDIQRVLDEADGVKTVAEMLARLGETYEAEDVQALLDNLYGEILIPLETAQAAPPLRKTNPRILIWGQHEQTAAIVEGLACWDIQCHQSDAPPSELILAGVELVIGIGEGLGLGQCLALQEQALASGTPAIFLTGEAGQVWLSPLVMPGQSACLACLRLAPFVRAGRLDPSVYAALATLQGQLRLVPRNFERARAFLLEQVRQFVQLGSASSTNARMYTNQGKIRETHVTPLADCPLCAAIRVQATPKADTQTKNHADQQWQILDDFSRAALRIEPGAERRALQVGIIGGGTAGYLAGLALRRYLPEAEVTLIESSAIPVIGVGEATTPLMPQFLHADLGLEPERFFAQVQPTFKLGIQFHWGARSFNYPFGAMRLLEPRAYDEDLTRMNLQSMMMAAGKLPAQDLGPGGLHWLPATQLAYHLDNRRFVAYLAEEAVSAGITVRDCEIEQVKREGERIVSLCDRKGQEHSFDFYLDCTGFRSLLMGDALASPYRSFAKSLFADSALMGALPVSQPSLPYTKATALNHGWNWEIPQVHERHLGYVFSSSFCSPSDAEAELRSHHPALGPTRLLRFSTGRHEHFIKGNVAALGNAYGFVEPLESTSLHMLIRQIGLLCHYLPRHKEGSNLAQTYNDQVNDWWDYLCWFLAIHYRFNKAKQSPFWQACREQVDVSAYAHLLQLFEEIGPLSESAALPAFSRYPDPLWGPEGIDTLLLGQGATCPGRTPRLSPQGWARWCNDGQMWLKGLADPDRVLAQIATDPRLGHKIAGTFARLEPAFGFRN